MPLRSGRRRVLFVLCRKPETVRRLASGHDRPVSVPVDIASDDVGVYERYLR